MPVNDQLLTDFSRSWMLMNRATRVRAIQMLEGGYCLKCAAAQTYDDPCLCTMTRGNRITTGDGVYRVYQKAILVREEDETTADSNASDI